METKQVRVGDIVIGRAAPVVLIAGPCVIESAESAMEHAVKIKDIAKRAGMPVIFKASYDKANRSSIDSFRGPGIEKGLQILSDIREKVGIPVLSDVHAVDQVDRAASVLDIIQIPAFLCRQTDLLVKAGLTGKPVNVKKGQFMSPAEMTNVVHKLESTGNHNIMLTERGSIFGYNTLINDFRSIIIMGETGYPVVYDATHSVQKPGGRGASSGGDARYITPLAKAAVACGADALFLEVHENPKNALSDAPNMLKLSELANFIEQIKQLEKVVR
ncbi:MAG: 3-deoxy-8-phosphooctulonate synthase [Candidatus Omnitrophica bacterium]|nr:3-deoxy-8-phosphooctulonate synthase [Candidatus Omnitrophota bacterium]MBU1127834.1 3-deoxy-8-phosphooctulonate synthase [Candidatus Omnitrophota bacterium]MBU1656704.1 3-deoxy-8-phosphooctulonate synthase [Candidatus Omnitrophota bacterium]MBU1785092.1 3-deoxy-8-phosphooctulonate synthase [Candidatus Omnitrophota bacterium]MBU1851169.1 3-deoxy-8-phosphooctulonate synthase [Candidatus Omnitrophota bacterium]